MTSSINKKIVIILIYLIYIIFFYQNRTNFPSKLHYFLSKLHLSRIPYELHLYRAVFQFRTAFIIKFPSTIGPIY